MTTIAFTGDIAFSKYFKDHYTKDFCQKNITDFLKTADHVVANVEAPLTLGEVSSAREINHFSHPESASWLKGISADIWTIANNHILDCGEKGMTDTMDAAHSIDAVTVGAGKNKEEASEYITIDDCGGIGIFAVTYKRGEFIRAAENSPGCILFDDIKAIKETIEKIKSKNKWCIIIAHGGDEFCSLPLPYMRSLYRRFLKLGADAVVGHHPHVVQNYETVGNKVIFYSLGNFVFDTDYQRKQKHSEYGILIKLNFTENKLSWDNIAVKVNRQTQTVEECVLPAIFCNVSKHDYKLLWPLAAREFLKSFVVAKNFVMPKTLNYNAFEWFKFHIEKIGFKNALCVYLGKYISKLGLWKRADRCLREYIQK